MHGRSKCMSGLVFPPSKDNFNFGNEKKSHGAGSGGYGGEAKQLFLQKRRNYCGGMSRSIVM